MSAATGRDAWHVLTRQMLIATLAIAVLLMAPDSPCAGCHEKGRRYAVPRDISDSKADYRVLTAAEIHKIVKIAAGFVAVNTSGGDIQSGGSRHFLGQ